MRISKLPDPLLAFTYAKNGLSCVTWSSVSESSGECLQTRDSAAAPTLWFLRLVVGPERLRRWRTTPRADLMLHSFERRCVREASFIGVSQDGNHQFSSVVQSCPTLCDPMNCSAPGLPVHHQLPEFTHTHSQSPVLLCFVVTRYCRLFGW